MELNFHNQIGKQLEDMVGSCERGVLIFSHVKVCTER